jgi:SAM-dependent methyltransferase
MTTTEQIERDSGLSAYLRTALSRPALLLSANLLRFFRNKTGVVIGGRLRWHFGPLLKTARKTIGVDNCSDNFTESYSETHITDATDLSFAQDRSMDFVCSSHVFEHLANPLKAIAEWKRVVKNGGIIYIAVPDKRYTFDRKRDRTPLSHLIDDFNKNVGPDDQTHLAEFNEKWDPDPSHIPNKEELLQDVESPPRPYFHHHVWIVEDIQEILEHVGLKPVFGPVLHHGTIHAVGQKITE